MVNDHLSDFINRLKNAAQANLPEVEIRYTRILHEVAKTLKAAGYLKKVEQNGQQLTVALNPNQPITHLKRLSTPGLRHYRGYNKIPRPKTGFGLVVVSTPKGILDGYQAKKQKVGGELICEVW